MKGEWGAVLRVYVDETGPRPRLVLDIAFRGGEIQTFELDRTAAREMTRRFGRHPVVDAFFREGKAPQ